MGAPKRLMVFPEPHEGQGIRERMDALLPYAFVRALGPGWEVKDDRYDRGNKRAYSRPYRPAGMWVDDIQFVEDGPAPQGGMGASGWTAPPGEWFVDVLSPEGEGYVAVLQVRHAPGYTGDVILLDYIRVEKNEACDDGLDWMPAMYRLAEAVRKCERIAGDE